MRMSKMQVPWPAQRGFATVTHFVSRREAFNDEGEETAKSVPACAGNAENARDVACRVSRSLLDHAVLKGFGDVLVLDVI